MRPAGWQEGPTARKESTGEQTGWPGGEAGPAREGARLAPREAERFGDFLRCSVDWLWETDARLTLSYVSSPVALKLGIPAQVLIGRALMSLGRFTAGPAPSRQAPSAIEARRPFRDANFVMTGAENRQVAYRLSGVPYFDEATGAFRGFRGTAIALSQAEDRPAADDEAARALAETLEETLIRQQDLSWQLTRLKEAREDAPQEAQGDQGALSRTAHELRTPLNAIVGHADLALREVFGPVGERYLDCFRTIREAGRHLDRLISHLQASARPASEGDKALAAEVVDVADITANAKAMIALTAKAAEVDISRVGPLAGGRVIGDRVACTQILVNLLGNAVKFTPAAGSVGLETLVGADDKLQIAVWDTGIGIPAEDQARIFDPSYRAKTPEGHAASGLGLGLAISRDLARAMGGDITVTSQPGQGSRFVLSLPLASVPAAKDSATRSPG